MDHSNTTKLFKKYMQPLCNFYMSNIFYSAFRPRLDVTLTLNALRRDLDIWSGNKKMCDK